MSEIQASNPEIAQSDNLLDQSLTTQATPKTEITNIVELADEQLEVVVGGAGMRRPDVE
jgi:hypothetical protein